MDEKQPQENRDVELNAVGVLVRREIEARILAPVLAALIEEFGRERVLEIVDRVIVNVAQKQGHQIAAQMGVNDLSSFANALEAWKKGDALQIEVIEQNQDVFAFNVTKCRFAEMYRDLGIPELGKMLSCSRDFSLIEGFNPEILLERSQTIMDGAPYCNFRYTRKDNEF